MIINEIVSAILQVAVFTLIPFLVFVIKTRSTKGFFHYIGFTPGTKKANLLAAATSVIFLIGILILVLWNERIKEVMTTPPSITGKLRALGMSGESIAILLTISCIKTSLSEEIFFRGFIAKRLMSVLGYKKGNFLQAFIFALVHVLLFWMLSRAGVFFLAFIFTFSGLAAYIIGYIKEKMGNGSIIPGWIAHALGNTLSYFIIAFVI